MSRLPQSSAIVVLAMLLAAAGCGKPADQGAQQAQTPQAAPPNVPAHMADHFTRVREIEESIIRGDLEAAKAPARWLADHQETAGVPAGTDRPIKEMKAAAASVASSNDVGTAAIAAASLVGACGSCHSASRVTPKLPPVSEPTPGKDRKHHMMEHQLAIDHMYRGLISPTSEDWRKGAEALKAAPLGGKAMADISTEAAASEARVHELADRAIGAAEKSARVTIYGSIIGECANCHGLHGRVWGPGMPKTQ